MTSPSPRPDSQSGGEPSAAARKLWMLTGGQAWEPTNPNATLIVKLIEDGYLRRTDGICGFERFKDSMVTWTRAGRAALSKAGAL